MEEKAKVQTIPEEELKKVSGGRMGGSQESKTCNGFCTCDENIRSAEDCPPGQRYVGDALCC